jgi:tRNA (guanine10-N2)-dimethyltransferase
MASPKPSPSPARPNQSFFFILGRETELSVAEIAACLADRIDPNIEPRRHGQALVLTADATIDPARLMHRLGGTVKFGRIMLTSTLDQLKTTLAKGIFESGLLTLADKVAFGISVYGDKNPLDNRAIVRLGMEIKKELRQADYAGRFVNQSESALSSVSVTKNKLIAEGGEIVLIVADQTVLIGRTEAVQDFELYSHRDYGRPGRDMIQGMLPPKLAQMMINLAQGSTEETLLDPFCGSGTVLQEACLLGFQKLIGSDTNSKAIQATRQNIDWLLEQIPNQSTHIQIENYDATKLSESITPKSIGTIVTEPYLGPIRPPRNLESIKKIRDELTDLYALTLTQFQKVLRPDGRVAMIVPCWFVGQTIIQINLVPVMRKLGFQPISFPSWSDKNPFLYHRPGQLVGREIFVLKLNK